MTDQSKAKAGDENVPTINIESTEQNKVKEKRIKFESQRLIGSINLVGATVDDLLLKDYFETINKEKNINILSPENSLSPYFLRIGWASQIDQLNCQIKILFGNQTKLHTKKTKVLN